MRVGSRQALTSLVVLCLFTASAGAQALPEVSLSSEQLGTPLVKYSALGKRLSIRLFREDLGPDGKADFAKTGNWHVTSFDRKYVDLSLQFERDAEECSLNRLKEFRLRIQRPTAPFEYPPSIDPSNGLTVFRTLRQLDAKNKLQISRCSFAKDGVVDIWTTGQSLIPTADGDQYQLNWDLKIKTTVSFVR